MSLNKIRPAGESKVSDVNQGNKGGGGKSKIFLCYPRDSETSLSLSLFTRKLVFLVRRGLFIFD